jgi:hypothetical protein
MNPDQTVNGEPKFNRIVGGKESAKNFRKELKRYMMGSESGVTGANTGKEA